MKKKLLSLTFINKNNLHISQKTGTFAVGKNRIQLLRIIDATGGIIYKKIAPTFTSKNN